MGHRSRSRSSGRHRSSRSHRHRSRSYDSRKSRESRRSRRSRSRSSRSRSESVHSSKRNLFDQKPEGIPEELLNSGGVIGAMANLQNNSEQQSKVIRRLLITNLPHDYQEIKLKDFLTDIINKCVDQEIQQPPILSLIAFKDSGNAMIELQTPEMATACLAMDGIPYEGVSIGVVRPSEFNPEDVPPPVGRPPRLHMDKVGYTPKLGAHEIAAAQAQSDENDRKIFIGNLATGIDESNLQALFSPFGDIQSVAISRDPQTHESKGFGYIVFTEGGHINEVCEKMNGLKLCENPILVRPAAVKQVQTVVVDGNEEVKVDTALAMESTFDLPNLKGSFIAESHEARKAAAKLLKQAGISTGGHIQKSLPSRIIVLKNMVTKEDLENTEEYLDIKADIETECSRFGQVLSMVIPRGESPGVGNVIVEYPSIQQAASAVVSLIGRRFNNHIVRASFMSETAFVSKQYNV